MVFVFLLLSLMCLVNPQRFLNQYNPKNDGKNTLQMFTLFHLQQDDTCSPFYNICYLNLLNYIHEKWLFVLKKALKRFICLKKNGSICFSKHSNISTNLKTTQGLKLQFTQITSLSSFTHHNVFQNLLFSLQNTITITLQIYFKRCW